MADDSRTSTLRLATPPWVSFAMPSVADLLFLGIFGVLLFTPLANRLLGDAGTGWHIRTGQHILATRAIPRTDPFSSTMSGRPWFAWEWLYDVVVAELHYVMGLNGIVWFTALAIASVFAGLFRFLIARGTNLVVAILLALLAACAATIHFLARPHVLSWLFALVWFWILDSSERAGFRAETKNLWLLPASMLIWVNVHGGFLLGFVLVGIFLVGALWGRYRATGNRIEESIGRIAAVRRAWNLFWVGLASVVASLVNPYGWKLHAHIYSYLTNRFLMDHVDEFKSPNFHGVAQKCFLFLLLITLATLAARGSRLNMSRVLTALFATYAALYATRNIPVASTLLVMVVGPLLRHGDSQDSFFERMTRMESGSRGHLWSLAFVVFALLICVNGGSVGSDRLIHAQFDSNRMPVEAVNYIEQHGLHGPIFAPDSWGGYLIYRLYPRERVVLDDRHDLYGEAFLKGYLAALHGEPGWQDFLHEHEIGCMVLPRNIALSSLLLENGTWKPIYTDSQAVVFVSNQ